MAHTAEKEYLACTTGTASIAVDVGFVQEIYESRFISRLPGCPGFVLGMINIRGLVMPVLDLLAVHDPIAPVKKIVILKTSEDLVGLLITQLDDLQRFETIEPVDAAPSQLKAIAHALSGKAPIDGKDVYIIDVEKLISSTIAETAR